MYVQPKDEIKETPKCIIRWINYKESDKSMTEGPSKNTESQILPGLSSNTYSCLLFWNVIQGTNVHSIKREGILEWEYMDH